MKKLVTVSLIVLLLVVLLCACGGETTTAAGPSTGSDQSKAASAPALRMKQEKGDDGYTCHGFKKEDDPTEELVIPGQYKNKAVIAVGSSAFVDNTNITSLTLPESVEYIGINAFFGCTELAELTLPENLKYIGNAAFSDCKSLTELYLPESVENLGTWAFSACTALERVVMAGVPDSMGMGCTFKDCSNLKVVYLPAGMESVSREMFRGCDALEEIHFAGSKDEFLALEFRDRWLTADSVLLCCADGNYRLENAQELKATDEQPAYPTEPEAVLSGSAAFTGEAEGDSETPVWDTLLGQFAADGAGDGQISELPVVFRDALRRDLEQEITLLETEEGYYIPLDSALSLLDLTDVGGDYLPPYGHVRLRAETEQVERIHYGGQDWYDLEDLMTELDTAVLPVQGQVYYRSLPVNQDRLIEEIERIFSTGNYQANLLSDSPVLSGAAAAFSFGFDVLWNQRFTFMQANYAEDTRSLMLDMLRRHEDSESLAAILGNALDAGGELSDAVFSTQKLYEDLGRRELLSGGEWLFGAAGSGPLEETVDSLDVLQKGGAVVSDMLGAAVEIYTIGSLPTLYADALERVMATEAANNYPDTIVHMQADKVLRIFNSYLEENSGQLAAEGVLLFGEDIVNGLVTEAVQEGLGIHPASGVVKLVLEVMDSQGLQAFRKNDSVRDMMLCAQIQQLFLWVCSESEADVPDAQTALALRDAATLYLKCAWLAYDQLNFDQEIKAWVGESQNLINDELRLLAGFADGMFDVRPNEPMPVGCLSFHREKQAPAGTEGRYHKDYSRFVQEKGYLDWVKNDTIRQELQAGYGGGSYWFHDVDRDGNDDLLVWLGCSGADGELLLFSGEGREIVCWNSVPCDGSGIGLYGSDRVTGLILSVYDGYGELLTNLDVAEDTLVSFDYDVPSDSWYPTEPEGWL